MPMNPLALRSRLAAFCVGVLVVVASQAHGQVTPQPVGQRVYEQVCAACHAAPQPGSRASPVALLRKMSPEIIRTALTTGPMRGVGEGLSAQELDGIVAYLAGPTTTAKTSMETGPPACDKDRLAVNLAASTPAQGWGIDQSNHRRLTAQQAGLRTADLARLQVAWALGFPGTTSLRSQGVIVGSTLFYAAGQAGELYALDTKTGCAKWRAKSPAEIRTSLALGRAGKTGPFALAAGDSGGQVAAWDALSGKLLWRVDPRPGGLGMLTGTPIFAGERLIVPVSAIDVALAMRPSYACCQGHGAVVALAAASGAKLWTYDTMPAAKPLGVKNSLGVEMQGPSGAPIWSSPSIDSKRGLVFTATGENTSPPATETSDSVIALDLATGKMKWVFQALKNDIWNMSCPIGHDPNAKRPPGPNCFFAQGESVLRDHDFGAGPMLLSVGARDMVLAGQKSGDVWGLDRASGKVVWSRKFGPGTALGGVHWGMTTDGDRLIVPISDPGVPESVNAAGLHALDPLTGKSLWDWKVQPDCAGDRASRVAGCMFHAGISAAPLVIDQVILAGALDGRLWVLDAKAGSVLAVHDTARAFQTLNGVAGAGGAIDATGVFAGDGTVFVNSGYAQFGEQPGNVLIAYRPKP